MKPHRETNEITELLARELHRQYRAAAKAMGSKGPQAHDHGVRDCGQQKFKYFVKRARLLIVRASCRTPETLGQAEEALQAMILIRRCIVDGEPIKSKECLLCHNDFDTLGGITTTEGYACYGCVARIQKISDQAAALRERPQQDILSDIDGTP